MELFMADIVIKDLSKNIANTILTGFNRHFSIFSKITKGAQERFENADWEINLKVMYLRFLDLY